MAPTTTTTPPQISRPFPATTTTTTMANPSTNKNDTAQTQTQTQTQPTKKRKRNATAEKEPHILHQTTFRKTQWSYFHIVLVTPSSTTTSTSTSTSTPNLSPLLALTLLTTALRTYLGTTGAAIPMDMLKIQGRHVWLRVPRCDARGMRAALSSWVGSVERGDLGGGEAVGNGVVGCQWRVKGEGGLGALGEDGEGLFG